MTTTRRDYLTQKYNELITYFVSNYGVSPFPSLDDIDLTDVLFLLVHHFSPLYDSHDYRKPLRELLAVYIVVDDDEFEKHYPYLQKEIDGLLEFVKSQK